MAAHRAFLRLSVNTAESVVLILAPLTLTALWVYFSPVVSGAWSLILENGRLALGMPGETQIAIVRIDPIPAVPIPFLAVPAAPPSWITWIITAVVTVVAGFASLFLRGRFTPIAYMVRAVLIVQATALIFFLLPRDFPYGIDDYTLAEMSAGFSLVALLPIVLGLVYFVFDFHVLQKIGLTVLVMAHLTLLIPLQFLLHAFLIHRFSLLFMPVLFIFFALPLEVMIGIAFYGWGMSWHDRTRLSRSP